MPGHNNKQTEQQHDAGKNDQLIHSGLKGAVPHSLDKDHNQLTAIQSGERQQVHNPKADTENPGKKHNINKTTVCCLTGHHSDSRQNRKHSSPHLGQ